MRATGSVLRTAAALLAAATLVAACSSQSSSTRGNAPVGGSGAVVKGGKDETLLHELKHDVSQPLRTMAKNASAGQDPDQKEADGGDGGAGDPDKAAPSRTFILPHPKGGTADPVTQKSLKVARTGTAAVTPLAPTTGAGFDTVGTGMPGFTVNSAPPDTDAAVGPTQIVTVVNSGFAVQSKTGTVLLGPVNTNTVFSGFGGACQTTNDGDAIVRYDRQANRWMISQFANVSSATGPYFECVAVSTTADATGTWNRYSFQYANFPDYPKIGVWPDAYYVTYNMFNPAGTAFLGTNVCALDRTKMLAGAAATQQCFTTSTSFGGLLPSDVDSATLPPAGQPNLIIGQGTTATTLAYWNFHVDFTTPANSTFTGPSTLTVASYTPACNGGTCIPQPGTTNKLDSLADRLMNRFAYRNFGDHQALVVSQSVVAGTSVGVRWYEIRLSGTTPSIFQQGTFAPDASYRWMPSAAFDKAGNIAIGYSLSNASAIRPSIAFSGRVATDPLGTLSQGETVAQAGGGSQTGTLTRWGDYATMNIDPADDCTFWFSTEYLKANGTFNWSTHINSFQLPGCAGPVTPDFTIASSPTASTISPGATATATISTVNSGTAQTVALTATGVPAGATASFSPASITSGGSSTLTITTTTALAPGTYPITITGTGSVTHSTTYTLTVVAPNFTIAVAPTSGSVVRGSAATATVSTTAVGTAQTVALSASGLPTGVTAAFSPASVTAGGSSTLTLSTASTAVAGTYPITVTGTAPSGAKTATYSLTVTTAPVAGITNGGFELGSLSGWTPTGVEGVVSTAHTGVFADRGGNTVATNGDSKIVQTAVAPTGATKLTFWYNMTCPDTITFDWATATLRDNTTGVTTTVLAKTCTNGAGWKLVSATVVAGHSYTLSLISHDDNFASDPTFTLYDDVTFA
jgi:hypothetical protein